MKLYLSIAFLITSFLCFSDEISDEIVITPQQAFELAIRNSAEIKHLYFQQKMSQSQVKLQFRQFLPQFSITYSQNDSVTYSDPDSRIKQYALSISQLIFDAGRTGSALKIGAYENQLNLYQIEIAKQDILFNVLSTYIDIIKFRKQCDIQSEAFRVAKIQYEIATKELELGTITEIDFLDIKLSMKNLEIELNKVNQQERLLFHKFSRLIGVNLKDKHVTLLGFIDPNYNGFLDNFEEEYWFNLFKINNIEYLKSQFVIFTQKNALEQAKFSWLPDINLDFSFTISGEEYPLTEPGFTIGITFNFKIPVLPSSVKTSAGKKSSKERSTSLSTETQIAQNIEGVYSVEIAKEQLLNAIQKLDELEQDTFFKIQELLISLKNSMDLLSLLKEKSEIEQKRKEIQLLKLNLGEIKRIDYLETEIELSKLKMQFLDSIVSFYNQEISLLNIAGDTNLINSCKKFLLLQEL